MTLAASFVALSGRLPGNWEEEMEAEIMETDEFERDRDGSDQIRKAIRYNRRTISVKY